MSMYLKIVPATSVASNMVAGLRKKQKTSTVVGAEEYACELSSFESELAVGLKGLKGSAPPPPIQFVDCEHHDQSAEDAAHAERRKYRAERKKLEEKREAELEKKRHAVQAAYAARLEKKRTAGLSAKAEAFLEENFRVESDLDEKRSVIMNVALIKMDVIRGSDNADEAIALEKQQMKLKSDQDGKTSNIAKDQQFGRAT